MGRAAHDCKRKGEGEVKKLTILAIVAAVVVIFSGAVLLQIIADNAERITGVRLIQ